MSKRRYYSRRTRNRLERIAEQTTGKTVIARQYVSRTIVPAEYRMIDNRGSLVIVSEAVIEHSERLVEVHVPGKSVDIKVIKSIKASHKKPAKALVDRHARLKEKGRDHTHDVLSLNKGKAIPIASSFDQLASKVRVK